MIRLVIYFLLLSLVTVSVVGAVAYLRAKQALTQAVFDQLEAAAILKEDELDRWIGDQREDVLLVATLPDMRVQAEALLQLKADDPAYQAAHASLSDYLAGVADRKQDMQEILILDAQDGHVVHSTDPDHVGDIYADAEYFTLGRIGPTIQNVYVSPDTGKPVMTIATPLLSEVGLQLGGVLVVHLNLERMDKIILKRAGLGTSGQTYLVDRSNAFVSSERFGQEEFPGGVHSKGIDKALQGKDGSGLYANYEGTAVIGVYRWIGKWGLALLTEMEQGEAFAPARQLLVIIFLVGLAAAGVLAVGVYLLARQITRPIIAITDTALQVAAGDLTPEAPVQTEDEVGVLARTFNLMTEQLRTLYEEIGRNERRFRSLIENINDWIWEVDQNGVFTYTSPRVKDMLGYEPEDVIGKTPFDLMLPNETKRVTGLFQAIVETREVFVGLENARQHKDGHLVVFETSGVPIFDADGNLAGYRGIDRDVTQRAQAEAEHEHMQQEIITTQQQAILELSTPVIPITDRIIVLPLMGSIDSQRAQDVMRTLLAGIRAHRARVVIIDITGVPIVDSGVANHLNKTIQAAQLKGAQTIITGISDAVAEAVVDLGIDWSGIETLRDLQTGLTSALAKMGRRIEE